MVRSARTPEWQARPRVHQSEDFAHNVKSVASAAPPVARVKRIFGGRAHDNAAFCRRELSPEEPRAPRVRLAGDEDDGAILLSTERTTDYPDFVGGIHNGRFKHMNGSCGNSFMDQNASAVDFFRFVRNSHCLQGFSRLGGVRKPHLRRVTLGVESGRFQSPHRHSATKHDNRPRFRYGVLHYEPSPDAKKRDKSQSEEA